MKDHRTWRPSWLAPRSEYAHLESMWGTYRRRHELAVLSGVLTVLAGVGMFYLFG